MDPDLVLLDRWCGGDQHAGHALFTRHFNEVYRFLEGKVGGDADDVAQRTFLACVTARDQFRRQSTFRTFLFAIARHELYRHLRQLRRAAQIDFELSSIAELVSTPGTRLGRARAVEQLRAALRELAAEQQLLLELHYWHDLDAGALAEVFEASAATMRVRLLRARRALREKMAQLAPDAASELEGDRMAASLREPDGDAAEGSAR